MSPLCVISLTNGAGQGVKVIKVPFAARVGMRCVYLELSQVYGLHKAKPIKPMYTILEKGPTMEYC